MRVVEGGSTGGEKKNLHSSCHERIAVALGRVSPIVYSGTIVLVVLMRQFVRNL